MDKIVHFLRKSVIIPIGLGAFFIALLLLKKETAAIWLAHIWVFIYYWPTEYELSGSFNLAFCSNPLLKSEKNSGFRKKVKLKSLGKRLFCGYDAGGNMLWLPLVYQCVFLVYAFMFVLLNVLFVVMFVTAKADLTLWVRIWLFEIVVQWIIFAIVLISASVKDVCLWSKKKKDPNYSKESNFDWIKSDLRMLKNKKIIKKQREISDFLKRYGLQINKHKRFFVNSADLKSLEDALINKFHRLHTAVFENQKGELYLNVCDAKTEDILIQIKITKS